MPTETDATPWFVDLELARDLEALAKADDISVPLRSTLGSIHLAVCAGATLMARNGAAELTDAELEQILASRVGTSGTVEWIREARRVGSTTVRDEAERRRKRATLAVGHAIAGQPDPGWWDVQSGFQRFSRGEWLSEGIRSGRVLEGRHATIARILRTTVPLPQAVREDILWALGWFERTSPVGGPARARKLRDGIRARLTGIQSAARLLTEQLCAADPGHRCAACGHVRDAHALACEACPSGGRHCAEFQPVTEDDIIVADRTIAALRGSVEDAGDPDLLRKARAALGALTTASAKALQNPGLAPASHHRPDDLRAFRRLIRALVEIYERHRPGDLAATGTRGGAPARDFLDLCLVLGMPDLLAKRSTRRHSSKRHTEDALRQQIKKAFAEARQDYERLDKALGGNKRA